MNNNNKIRKDSKRSTRKENSDLINETEAIMKQLEQLSFSEDKSFDDPTSFQKSRINVKNGTKELINTLFSNIPKQNSNDINKINDTNFFNSNINSLINNNINNNKYYVENIEFNDKKEILNLKLENILSTLRLSDIKINIKYYSSLFKFKDYLKDNNLIINCYPQLNDLFNIIIELLFIIKKEYEKNEMNNNHKNNKNGKIMKLEKEINYKDKQIGELLNKLKIEQQKSQRNLKDNSNELNALKKENRELYYQLSVYKNQIKKIDANNLILEEKLNNLILDKLNKKTSSVSSGKVIPESNGTINMNNNININNFNGIYSSIPSSEINFRESIKSENIGIYKKNNKEEIIQQNRKMNVNLINLLKESNKILGVIDLSLNKINIDDTQTNIIINLNNMIDFNILIDPDKMDNFYCNYLGNMDKILKKIDKLIENYKKSQIKKIRENSNNSSKRLSSSVCKRNKKQDYDKVKPFLLRSNEKSKNNKILVNRKNFIAVKEGKPSQKNIKNLKI